jgi:serine-type D-Ala-D-Ala carboxypeptidase (penicillin-binding protein 5/6)
MGIGATILMVIFFPLNAFLLIQEGFSGENRVQADASAFEQNVQGLVKGAETKKTEEAAKPEPKAQAVDNPKYQPVRKDGIKDLVVSNAHASVIIDADSGMILQHNNGRDHRQIASLTKLMTAVLVMEKIKDLDEEVAIDEEAVYADGTKVGCLTSGNCTSRRLQLGEKISARNLLQAMLMNSANDTAIALGKHISGSQEAFVDLMNEKAKNLGLTDTHFCTASGLDLDDDAASGCYSSAYDIARIAAYSLRFDTIWKIARTPSNLVITSMDGKIQHTILNTDRYLDQKSQPLNLIGTKTGYTPLAGYSLLTIVTDPSTKHRIVAVVLDDPQRWQDVKDMINWAFDSYTWE